MKPLFSATRFLAALAVASCCAATAQQYVLPFEFTDVTDQVNLGEFINNVHGGGVSVEDVDDDGDFDLFLAQSDGEPALLYLWDDAFGRYVERASQWGLDVVTAGRVSSFFDYNADGLLDLLIVTEEPTASSAYRLFEQTVNSSFIEVTAAAGLSVPPTGFNRAGTAVADINNDGYLDFWSGMWDRDGTANGSLFLNNGDGTFTDITASSGILTGTPNTQWQSTWHDFDGDGFQDLYLNIDFEPNKLFLNQQNNTFVDVAPAAGLDNAMNDMGLALGDYDSDGDFDLYITNIKNDNEHNVLFRNDSVGAALSFTDVSESLGVESGGWGWGTAFFDADNDGHLDIIANNGFGNPPNDTDETIFHRNRGGGTFSPNRARMVNANDRDWTVGVVPFDYDNDGDMDYVQTTNGAGIVRLMQNDHLAIADRNSIQIRPRMGGNNKFCIGGTVTCTTSFNTQMRLMTVGSSYQSQEPAVAFFGLKRDDVAQEVTVNFPDGSTTTLFDVAPNQLLEVAPPPLTDYSQIVGERQLGNLLSLRASDNERLRIEGRVNASVVIGFSTSVVSPSSLEVAVECGADQTGIQNTVSLFNWNATSFDDIDSFTLATNDSLHTLPAASAADYIDSNGRVEVRISANPAKQANPFGTFEDAFRLLIDHVDITVN